MQHIEFTREQNQNITEIGLWLEEHMPKPMFFNHYDDQRWYVGTMSDGRMGIAFRDEEDAIWFKLRWS